MKFLNWSKAAQAGESVTMSPSSARSRAVSTARSKGVTSRISGLARLVAGGVFHGGADLICRRAAENQQLDVLDHLGSEDVKRDVLVIAARDQDDLAAWNDRRPAIVREGLEAMESL